MGSLCNPISGVSYFLLYSLLVRLLFFLLGYLDFSRFSRLGGGFRVSSVSAFTCLSLCMVRLAGMPPTIGFSIKWSVFLGMLPGLYTVLAMLVLGSLMRLYYYLCVIFSWCIIFFSAISGNTYLLSVGSGR